MNTLFMILMTPNSTLFPYTTLFRSEVIVNADDDVESARLLDWRGNDDSFDTAFKITLQLLLLQELARAFENDVAARSEEHTSELQSHVNLVCRLLLEKKNN